MKNTARVAGRSHSEITFKVDDVQPFQNLRSTQPGKQQFEEKIGTSLLAFSYEDSFEVVQTSGNCSLVSAVHLAFSEHCPLLLTPDAIWMAIAQGFAQYINNNSEQLRNRFVTHSGKQILKATAKKVENLDDWALAIHQWTLGIRDCVGADMYQLMLCNFSTTTPIIETASQVVMIDAFKQYFDYRMYAVCGIPWITVQGTVEDWRKIRDRIDILTSYDLDWWTKRLIPIGDAIIDTVAGNPSLDFWKGICKPESAYGGDVITGWIVDLFPYIQNFVTKIPTERNPILDVPREEITVRNGLRLEEFPNGLSQVSCVLETPYSKQTLELVAGFIGISQNSITGCLQPEIGWGVREAGNFSKLLNIIVQNHHTQPPFDWSKCDPNSIFELPKEFIQMLERFNGGTLFADTKSPWFIRPVQDYQYYLGTRSPNFIGFIDLKDDRRVAFGFISRFTGNFKDGTFKRLEDEIWIVVGKPIKVLDFLQKEKETLLPEDTIIIAKGLPEFFERVIQSQGRYYFDEPDFVRVKISDCENF